MPGPSIIWWCRDVTRRVIGRSNSSGALRTLLTWAARNYQLTMRVEKAVASCSIKFPCIEDTTPGVRAKQVTFFFSFNSLYYRKQVVFAEAGKFS